MTDLPKLPPVEMAQWLVRSRCIAGDLKLHPAISRILFDLRESPTDWTKVQDEWPHVSTTDSTRLAYSRSAGARAAGKYTVTTLGKYLARHWPHIPDHIRRDWAALQTSDEFKLLRTVDEMVSAVEVGPRSCMGSPECYDGDDSSTHPYAAYDPVYGWRLAIRTHEGSVDGRCLCLEVGDTKKFVRSYKRADRDADDQYSYSDEKLEAWLKSLGYAHVGYWPDGTKLAKLAGDFDAGFMAPYLDGATKTATAHSDHLEIRSGGGYTLDNTDGDPGENSDDDEIGTCETCGTTIREGDDYANTGRGEDNLTCQHCVDHHFQWAVGCSSWRSGRTSEYYVHSDDAVEVGDEWYDRENLPDYIVQLEDGGYAKDSDTVSINGDNYLDDDERVVALAESNPATNETHALKADAWQDDDSQWWASEAHYLQANPVEEEATPTTT